MNSPSGSLFLIAWARELAEHFFSTGTATRLDPMKISHLRLPIPRGRLAAATLSALLLGAACSAAAQTLIPSLERQDHVGDLGRAAREKAVARFDGADADKDGRLSKAEVEGRLSYVAENFDRLDTNHDGYLSWQEFIGHDRWKKE